MAKVRWLACAGLAATLAIAAAWFAWREPDYTRVPVRSLQDLEQQLESLRTELGIPGMSAAIAEGDRVIWARGLARRIASEALPRARTRFTAWPR